MFSWLPSTFSTQDKHNQPDFYPQLVVQRLRKDLASAQDKLEEHEELIAFLYTTLGAILNNVCPNCRANVRKFAPANLSGIPGPITVPSSSKSGLPPSPSPSDAAKSSNYVPFLHHIFKGDWGIRLYSAIHPTDPSNQSNAAILRDGPSVSDELTTSFHASSASASGVQVSPDPESAHGQSNESVWRVEYNPNVKLTLRVKLEYVLTRKAAIRGMRFSQDGKYFAFGLSHDDGRTFIYNVQTGKQFKVLEDISLKLKPGAYCLRFSPDGKYLAVGYAREIRVWEIAKRHVRNMFQGHESLEIYDLDFSPDGRSLISTSRDRTVRVWRMRDGSSKVLRNNGVCRTLRVTPDGRYIAGANYDGTLRIWNIRMGKLMEAWKAHEGGAWGMVLTPDGKALVSSGRDTKLKSWNVSFSKLAGQGRTMTQVGNTRKKKKILTFMGHAGDVWWVAVSPDGQWVISGSADCTVRIWSSHDASLQCTLHGHTKDIVSVHFSPTGKYLAIGSDDGQATVWTYEAD